MNFVTRRWRDTHQPPLCGLNTIPARHFRLDEPALLRRAELLNHRVEARLPLLAVVAIDGHVFLLRGGTRPCWSCASSRRRLSYARRPPRPVRPGVAALPVDRAASLRFPRRAPPSPAASTRQGA